MSVKQATAGKNAALPSEEEVDPRSIKPAPVVDEELPKEEDFDLKPYSFSRIAGGPGSFCGVAPLSCWGRETRGEDAAFVDVAMTEKQVCAIQYTGTLRCLPMRGPANLSARRIAGSATQFCALGSGGEVSCWGDGEVAKPPADLKAKFFAVADEFACAADEKKQLRCWGKTEGLGLPDEALVIKDLAAGSNFVCVLAEQGGLRCFGAAPDVPAGDYSAVGAGFKTVCAASSEGGQCWGAVNHKFTQKVKRFAVSDIGVCAQLDQGQQDCVDTKGKPIALPLDKKPYEEAVRAAQARNADARREAERRADAQREELEAVRGKKKAALFEEMRSLFPQAKERPSLLPSAKFSFGDRIPAKFDLLFKNFAADHLVGVQWENPGGTLSLSAFHLPSQSVHLYVFSQGGNLLDDIQLWERREKSYKQGNSTVRWAEGEEHAFDDEGHLVTTKLTGTETIFHTKGGKGTSKIQCLIGGESYLRQFGEYGLQSKKKRLPRPKSISRSSLTEGCGSDWPFVQEQESSFDPSLDNVVPASMPIDPQNPCAQLRDQKRNLVPGVQKAELVFVSDASGERWVPESTTQPEDFKEGGTAFGSLTGLRGEKHWQIFEQGTNPMREGGYSSTACYSAEGKLLSYELEVVSPSAMKAKKKVLVSEGKAPSNWSFSTVIGEPSSEAAFGYTDLLKEVSVPPSRVQDHPRFKAIERGLK